MLLVENRPLLDGFRRGDTAALTQVYSAYAPAIAAFLRGGFNFQSGGKSCRFKGARSEFDLEDRLHDVFGRAFSESARLAYDGLTPYKSYLFTIARNLVIDDFRKKEHALTEYAIEDAPATSDDASEPLLGHVAQTGEPHRDNESAELVALVKQFKESLAEREREIYVMRFEEELEHKDIAVRTGLSPSKIKTSEGRVRVLFFEFMKRHGYFTGYSQDRRGWLRGLGVI